MVAARAHGVRSIGVLWGYGSRSELNERRRRALPAPGELAACLVRIAV